MNYIKKPTIINGVHFRVDMYKRFYDVSDKKIINQIKKFSETFLDSGIISPDSSNLNRYLRGWLMCAFRHHIKNKEQEK